MMWHHVTSYLLDKILRKCRGGPGMFDMDNIFAINIAYFRQELITLHLCFSWIRKSNQTGYDHSCKVYFQEYRIEIKNNKSLIIMS